jgi:hypothetical protein
MDCETESRQNTVESLLGAEFRYCVNAYVVVDINIIHVNCTLYNVHCK